MLPTNCVLLVDTFNVKKGIENAITVGLEMRERGEKLAGIRIDSGDLAWLSRYARERLDAAGLTDCGIGYLRTIWMSIRLNLFASRARTL